MTSYVASRKEYDDYCRDNFILRGVATKDLPAALAERYPCATADASKELFLRGVQSKPWHIERWCAATDHPPRVIGGARLWWAADIDRAVGDLVDADRLTHGAHSRKLNGLSWAEEREMIRAVMEARHAKADESIQQE